MDREYNFLQKNYFRNDSHKRTKFSLNLKSDTELPDDSYFDILNKLSNY